MAVFRMNDLIWKDFADAFTFLSLDKIPEYVFPETLPSSNSLSKKYPTLLYSVSYETA